MKVFPKFMSAFFISFIISSFLFCATFVYLFIPTTTEDKTVQKTDHSISYSPSSHTKDFTILICIDKCPVIFKSKISARNKNVSVSSMHLDYANFDDGNANNESIYSGFKNKADKSILFTLSGFENIVNHLGGIEVETPYGLPAPSKSGKILAQNEKLYMFGASIGTLLTEKARPSDERLAYYCYIIGELCLKFLKECDTEDYKFLNQNSKTDINYTEFYDNYKSLKSTIKYAVTTSTPIK